MEEQTPSSVPIEMGLHEGTSEEEDEVEEEK